MKMIRLNSIKSRCAFAIVLYALASQWSLAGEKKGRTMTIKKEVESLLAKSSLKLLKGDAKEIELLELAVSDLNFHGLAIVAPLIVQTATEKKLPIAILSQRSILRGWEIPESTTLMLAISTSDGRNAHIFRALVDPKDDERGDSTDSVRPPKPTGNYAEGLTTKIHHIDVRPGLENFDWGSASLSVTAISFDWVSNTAKLELQGGEKRRTLTPLALAPIPSKSAGKETPTYDFDDSKLLAPEGRVNFEIKRFAHDIRINGSFSKIALAGEVLPKPIAVVDRGRERSVVAIVPLVVGLINATGSASRMLTLAVPIYGANQLQSGQQMRGKFSVDLNESTDEVLPNGHFASYVLMGGEIYGPTMFEMK